MPLSSLATVELQLCMRCLDQQSLLQLARCSRFTQAAASAPFAWAHLSTTVTSLQPNLARAISRSLLRFASASPLLLRWPPVNPGDVYVKWALRESDLTELTPLNVRGLDARGSGATVDWDHIISHRAFRNLTVLRLDTELSRPSVGSALTRMPLEELWYDGRISPYLAESLICCSRLTDLTLVIRPTYPSYQVMRRIGLCVKLRRLSVRNLQAEHFAAVVTDRMIHLQSLTLDRPECSVALDLARLSSLPALETIKLIGCPRYAWSWEPDDARPQLHSPLRQLILADSSSEGLALADTIQRILTMQPQLHITFELYRVLPSARTPMAEARLRDAAAHQPPPAYQIEQLAQLRRHAKMLQSMDPARISVAQPDGDDSMLDGSAMRRQWFSQQLQRACVIC